MYIYVISKRRTGRAFAFYATRELAERDLPLWPHPETLQITEEFLLTENDDNEQEKEDRS